MKIDALKKFCADVRYALELAANERVHDKNTSLGISNFPTGCCGDTTNLLAYLIYKEFRVSPLHRSGSYYEYLKPDTRLTDENSHAWLELCDFVIDLTADQFNDRGFNNPPVMVTDDHSFHDLFASRDSRFNPSVPKPPSLNPKLMKSFQYIREKLRERDWSL